VDMAEEDEEDLVVEEEEEEAMVVVEAAMAEEEEVMEEGEEDEEAVSLLAAGKIRKLSLSESLLFWWNQKIFFSLFLLCFHSSYIFGDFKNKIQFFLCVVYNNNFRNNKILKQIKNRKEFYLIF